MFHRQMVGINYAVLEHTRFCQMSALNGVINRPEVCETRTIFFFLKERNSKLP